MRRIIQHKLTRRNNRRRMNSIKNINQPRSLLRNSLQRITIRIARRHPLRSGLKQRPSTLAYGGGIAFDGEEEGSAAGYKGRSHGRARLNAEGALCGGQCGKDVSAWSGYGGFEVKVVGWAVAFGKKSDFRYRCTRQKEAYLVNEEIKPPLGSGKLTDPPV